MSASIGSSGAQALHYLSLTIGCHTIQYCKTKLDLEDLWLHIKWTEFALTPNDHSLWWLSLLTEENEKGEGEDKEVMLG